MKFLQNVFHNNINSTFSNKRIILARNSQTCCFLDVFFYLHAISGKKKYSSFFYAKKKNYIYCDITRKMPIEFILFLCFTNLLVFSL